MVFLYADLCGYSLVVAATIAGRPLVVVVVVEEEEEDDEEEDEEDTDDEVLLVAGKLCLDNAAANRSEARMDPVVEEG